MRPLTLTMISGKARAIPRFAAFGNFRPLHPEVVIKPGMRPLCLHERLQEGDWVYWMRDEGKHLAHEGDGRFLFEDEAELALTSENPKKYWYPFALRPVGNTQR